MIKRVVAAAFALTIAAAFPSDAQTEPKLNVGPWEKICDFGATVVCHLVASSTTEDTLDTPSYNIAGVDLILADDKPKSLRIGVADRGQIKTNVRVAIDGALIATFSIDQCDGDRCNADIAAGPDLVDRLKSARALLLRIKNDNDTTVEVAFPLASFASTLAAKGMDAKVIADQMKRLEEELKRKTKEIEERNKAK